MLFGFVVVGHVPHCRVPPQPSLAVPQAYPREAQVLGVQTHWFETQAFFGLVVVGHVPHCRMLPQPSFTVPQVAPCRAQLDGLVHVVVHWEAALQV